MSDALEKLRWERTRKRQVRDSFSRGIQYFSARDNDPRAFYIACGQYLAAGQRRLLDQDRRLVQILKVRVPAMQSDDHQAMDALSGRLDLAERALADFEAALAAYRRQSDGRADMEKASAQFLDVLVNVLGARSHSLRHLTLTLLSEEDWARIADISPEFLAAEAEAFAAVSAVAPIGLAPETMPSGGRG